MVSQVGSAVCSAMRRKKRWLRTQSRHHCQCVARANCPSIGKYSTNPSGIMQWPQNFTRKALQCKSLHKKHHGQRIQANTQQIGAHRWKAEGNAASAWQTRSILRSQQKHIVRKVHISQCWTPSKWIDWQVCKLGCDTWQKLANSIHCKIGARVQR